ncbi:MAG TPA: OmpH family outer membrane protein [Gemmataceae bacterium]|jgi:Skp family chaperone for outer membrane proteins
MRATLWACCAALSLVALIGVGRRWAEGEEKPEKSATRIGLLNLKHVIKKYDKYKEFQKSVMEAITPIQKKDAELRKRAESLSEKKRATDLPEKKKKIERELKLLQREIEDNTAEAKQVLGKMFDETSKAIYLEVREVAKRYAIAHHLDLVLHYNDPPPDEEVMSPSSIPRKKTEAGLRRLYSAPGIDITEDIVAILNHDKKSTR